MITNGLKARCGITDGGGRCRGPRLTQRPLVLLLLLLMLVGEGRGSVQHSSPPLANLRAAHHDVLWLDCADEQTRAKRGGEEDEPSEQASSQR